MNKLNLSAGKPYPLGATVSSNGINFAVFSTNAEKIQLCLFDEEGRETQLFLPEKTGCVFHGFIKGLHSGQKYGYRAYGEFNPQKGHYFNPKKLLLDPYAQEIEGEVFTGSYEAYQAFRADNNGDNAQIAPKSISVKRSFKWEGDKHPQIPWEKTVIYEAHLKGLTKLFPDLAPEVAGTYLALADERVIAHLKKLGITAIELLPIMQSDDEHFLQSKGLSNYWAYNTLAYFVVSKKYASNRANAAEELKIAVKALHKAGIEVILDIVFNHTFEQGKDGISICQRGLDNFSWYWLTKDNDFYNWSGCGNTVDASNPEVARFILDNLRYWVNEFHIDGFRFDLATVLGRIPEFSPNSPVLNAIYQDPLLNTVKLIAEPWDIGAFGYQLGNFPANFAEWNDKFRDDMRKFWLGGSGDLGTFATRFCGSTDIFKQDKKRPNCSINFITAHDGFTLNDLVSYNEKHNEANGENNMDGNNANYSHNHGAEGFTKDAAIIERRKNTSAALLTSLVLANGTPMLLAGDELRNSQGGNNNAYCQDNEISWLNWQEQNGDLQEYCEDLLAFRAKISEIYNNNWWLGSNISWINVAGKEMTIDDWQNHSIKAMQILLKQKYLIVINAKDAMQRFHLPNGNWKLSLAFSKKAKKQGQTFSAPHLGVWIFEAM